MKSHFWLGKFQSRKHFEAYFKETYSEEEIPISGFAKDLDVYVYDHDFLELGFVEEGAAEISTSFNKHSDADLWMNEFIKRAKAQQLEDVNALVFINSYEIEHPKSCEGEGYSLSYLGEIEY